MLICEWNDHSPYYGYIHDKLEIWTLSCACGRKTKTEKHILNAGYELVIEFDSYAFLLIRGEIYKRNPLSVSIKTYPILCEIVKF